MLLLTVVKTVFPLLWQQVSAQGEREPFRPQANSPPLEEHKTKSNSKLTTFIWESKRQHSWFAWIGLCPAFQTFPHFQVSEQCSAGATHGCWLWGVSEVLLISYLKELHHFPFSLWLASFPGVNKCTGKKELVWTLTHCPGCKESLIFKQGKSQ